MITPPGMTDETTAYDDKEPSGMSMAGNEDGMSEPRIGSPENRELWRRVSAEAAAGDDFPDAALLLDLAAHAEGRLEGEALISLQALLDLAPELAEDVAYAAASLGNEGEIVAFPGPKTASPKAGGWDVRSALRWGALAASLLVVGYLGFGLGHDAYGNFAVLESGGGGADLMDPSGGFIGLGES